MLRKEVISLKKAAESLQRKQHQTVEAAEHAIQLSQSAQGPAEEPVGAASLTVSKRDAAAGYSMIGVTHSFLFPRPRLPLSTG